jgi:hypothetical protein
VLADEFVCEGHACTVPESQPRRVGVRTRVRRTQDFAVSLERTRSIKVTV